jgi:serine/threonine protein kinase
MAHQGIMQTPRSPFRADVDALPLRAAAAPRPGDLLESRYLIDAAIAAGTHSIIYEATNVVTGKVLAVKWPRRPKPFESVVREARLAARVRHAFVVDVYDIGHHEGVFFLTMERIRGVSLASWLADDAIDCNTFMGVFWRVLNAVSALHASRVAHCDLKPANIVLTFDRRGRPRLPKLVDFGSARLLGASPETECTDPFVHMGSGPYMPREQRQGCSSGDHRVDIYALGVMLARCICRTCAQSSSRITKRSLEHVIRRATAADSGRRFEDVPQLMRAVRAAMTAKPRCVGSRRRNPVHT